MPLPTINSIVSRYLFGTVTPPSDLVSENLIRDAKALSNLPLSADDVDEYFRSGPGRFALGSEFKIVDKFFNLNRSVLINAKPSSNGRREFTRNEILALTGGDTFQISFEQAQRDDGRGDYLDRSFIWASVAYNIARDCRFILADDGKLSIENFSVYAGSRDIPNEDNFDFKGGVLSTIGNWFVKSSIDPSLLGRKVIIQFARGSAARTYTESDFSSDKAIAATWSRFYQVEAAARLALKKNELVNGLFSSGVTRFLDPDGGWVDETD